jgi:hypothetical protein
MNNKQLRKIQLTNMALWIAAIFLPILARAFASKDPKIFEFLMPIWQIMLALASTWMFGTLQKPTNQSPHNDVEAQ